MKKRNAICTNVIIFTLVLASFNFVVASTMVRPTAAKKHFDLKDKVKPLAPPGEGGKPTGPPLKVEIVSPADGSTLPPGTHRVLVSASAKVGVSNVMVKIDGDEATSWTDITSNFDGTHYYYDWAVGTDGSYVLTARVTASNGKSKEDTCTVHIGARPPQRWALVIGIADYSGKDSDLWHPDEDAKEMQRELLENGYPDSNVRVLLNRKATAQAILGAIEWLVSNEQAGDEVVFFYSGHGYRAEDGDWDADVESDGMDEGIVSHDFYGLPDGMLRDKFSAVESTKFALMFGSCHSGGMFDDDDDLQGEGRVIAAACKADQYGWDYMLLGNTLWGYWFVDMGLRADNAFSVEGAHAYAYPNVVAEQPDSEPQLYDNLAGDFGL
jgi:hypothetical protein